MKGSYIELLDYIFSDIDYQIDNRVDLLQTEEALKVCKDKLKGE